MISLPHAPDPSRLADTRARLDAALKIFKDTDAAPLLALTSEQRILLALLEHAEGARPVETVARIREGLVSFSAALEKGHQPEPREVWDHFLEALAINDISHAQLIASTPTELWEKPLNLALYPRMFQLKAVIALLHHDEGESARWIGSCYAAAFEDQPTEATKFELEDLRNMHQVLAALHKKAATAFHTAMQQRMTLRAVSFSRNGRNSPLGFIDLHGLGLCALARDRGMTVTVRHVYLPLELLDAAGKQPRDGSIDRK